MDSSAWVQLVQALCMLAGVLFLMATLLLLLYVTKLVCSIPSMFQDDHSEVTSEEAEISEEKIIELPLPIEEQSESVQESGGYSAVTNSFKPPPPDSDEASLPDDTSDLTADPAQTDGTSDVTGQDMRAGACGDSKTFGVKFGRIPKVQGLAFNIEPGIPVSVNITSGFGNTAGLRKGEFSRRSTWSSASETMHGLTGGSSTIQVTGI